MDKSNVIACLEHTSNNKSNLGGIVGKEVGGNS